MVEREQCKPQYDPTSTTGWGLLNALIQWLHDGTKSHREFKAWSTGEWQSGKGYNKDSLNGKEEVVLTIPNDAKAEALGSKLGMSKGTFKGNELLGASTLIKRLWWFVYLPGQIGISAKDLKKRHTMPNTHAIAAGRPFDDSDESDDAAQRDQSEKYFAILALDGDEMGKWISGSKSPEMRQCLSPNAIEFYNKNAPEFLDAPRAVTPSWHLQFSEALGNFSFHCAQRIVEAFNGRLLYAGGDDVLAMLPAKDALACARALRAAFRGEKVYLNQLGDGQLFALQQDGYLQLHENATTQHGAEAGLLSEPVTFPALLPGPATDVSVGIAIAHFKSPLQDIVRAAQAAEKRAKNQLGRAAVAITIMKRSGEILEWGCKWSRDDSKAKDSAGLQLLQALMLDLNERELNARFPHKLEALLTPYLPQSASIKSDPQFDEHFHTILEKEAHHALERDQGGFETHLELFSNYWSELSHHPSEGGTETPISFGQKLTLFINLLRTAAWSAKAKEEQVTYILTPHNSTEESNL